MTDPATPTPTVAVLMGSTSDWRIMRGAVDTLRDFGITPTVRVLSAHRTPHDMIAYGADAAAHGIKVIIAGAGGAAHLPGMLAATTTLPVIGVPIGLANLDGLDSLLSIVQMPTGVPVATVAIDGARNAAHLAARILAISDPAIAARVSQHQDDIAASSRASSQDLDRDLSADPTDDIDCVGGLSADRNAAQLDALSSVARSATR
jgi:5-(carboxyamino)imidazole ribonucleotide mutase